jgi:phosphoribosylformimino-5-aminoimidazole carboxamide ribonucleotide (ProFAR) isomerase
VDLGAARTGIRSADGVLAEMINMIGVPVQASGGIRDVRTAETLIGIGVSWVIFGPVAIEDPQDVREAMQNIGVRHVIIGVAARSGVVATDGGSTTLQRRAVEVIAEWVEQGVTQFIYRDVDQDGTLRGPKISTIGELQNAAMGNLTVAGEIGDVQHLRDLSEIGIESGVLGTLIYTGSIDFRAAVEEFHP